MNKAELIAAIAAKTGDTKKSAEEAVNAFVSVVTDSLKKGDKVQLVGFGSFEVRKRAARKGRNPQTKEQLEKEETHKLKKKSKYQHLKLQYSKLVKL